MDGWGEEEEDSYGGGGAAPPRISDDGGYGSDGAADDDYGDDDAFDEDDGIFSLEKLDQNFSSYGAIKLAIARNGVVTMATETGSLLEFDVRSQEITEIELPVRGDCDITGIFADTQIGTQCCG